jgi:diadenosine tetraphosphate (Ap4A) HIT family hydrolase
MAHHDQTTYDDQNIFAKILRGEIPCNKVAEDEHTLAFADINPARAVHVLVIPKGAYVDWQDFAARASAEEQAAFTRMIAHVAEVTGIADSGFRVISNIGVNGHQEVPHLHMHVLGGELVGRMVDRG